MVENPINYYLLRKIKYKKAHYSVKYPKVSIIVPNLNNARYLNECLDSIVNQTLKDIEIIVVDSGSTDGSLQIIKKFQILDERIKLIKVGYKSYGYQMNIGIDNANGEYIGIVESDDMVSLDMYQDLYKIAVENSCEMVKADFYRFTTNQDNTKNTIYNRICRDKIWYYNKVISTSENLETFRFIMNTWSGIYSRNFLKFYNIKHNQSHGAAFQDNGFWFQTFMFAKKAYFVNKPYYLNRRDNTNSSIYSRNKIFAFNSEYDFIQNIINKNKLEKFNDICFVKRLDNYMFNIKRIDKKSKILFLNHIKNDLKLRIKNKNVNIEFLQKKDLVDLFLLLEKNVY